MSKLQIYNVDFNQLEKQRESLSRIVIALEVAFPENRDLPKLQGLLAMLDSWSDERYHAANARELRDNPTGERTIVFGDQSWRIPYRIGFGENPHRPSTRHFKVIAFRKPRKGEYYISGALPQFYKAPNAISDCFLIAEIEGLE